MRHRTQFLKVPFLCSAEIRLARTCEWAAWYRSPKYCSGVLRWYLRCNDARAQVSSSLAEAEAVVCAMRPLHESPKSCTALILNGLTEHVPLTIHEANASEGSGLGAPLPHRHRDWAHFCHVCHVCIGAGLSPPTSAPGLGSPLPHPPHNLARIGNNCTGTGNAVPAPHRTGLVTSMPRSGLGVAPCGRGRCLRRLAACVP